jgi:hypothetical protein
MTMVLAILGMAEMVTVVTKAHADSLLTTRWSGRDHE